MVIESPDAGSSAAGDPAILPRFRRASSFIRRRSRSLAWVAIAFMSGVRFRFQALEGDQTDLLLPTLAGEFAFVVTLALIIAIWRARGRPALLARRELAATLLLGGAVLLLPLDEHAVQILLYACVTALVAVLALYLVFGDE